MDPQNVISAAYNSSTGLLTLDNSFSQDFVTSQLVEFVINTGISNGPSSKPVTGFFIQTLDGNGAVID
jgi:hypothetical protein